MPSPTYRAASSRFDRRRFVSLCGAGLIAPGALRAQNGIPANPDVVIIGAGAAGIAAAHVMQKAGMDYVHIEAGSRVGGRAHTETESFGVPHDRGAHWVQSQTRNPYFNRAKASPHRFYKARDTYRIFARDRDATDEEEAALWNVWTKIIAEMDHAGRKGLDVSPASVTRAEGAWARTALFGIGPWEMGKDMDNFSCLDWWESADSVDWYCAEGYGTLVADHARGLPIELNTPATRIRWSGPGVEVETPRGSIRARAVIVTVSTGVLAEGGIAFEPALPTEKQNAFHEIEMGDYNHITLKFAEDIFGLGEDGYLLHQVDDSNEAFGALTNASNSGLAYCDVGGSFARDLEAAGEAAAIDFVKGKLRNLIGSEVDRQFQGAAVTAWRSDPLYRGCYASARPGSHPMRDALRLPVADRIYFAGEACHRDLWATVGGADLSGEETASMVVRALAK